MFVYSCLLSEDVDEALATVRIMVVYKQTICGIQEPAAIVNIL